MLRLLSLLLILLSAISTAAAAEISLRPLATVRGAVVRLGDLFEGVGERAQLAVAPAPAPGAKTVYDAAWLGALAREQHLVWEPRSRFEQVTIERASQSIDAAGLADRLRDALGERENMRDAEIRLDDPGAHLVIGADQPRTIAVSGLDLDPRSGRFSALVSAPAEDAGAERLRLSGRLIRRTEVPVPIRLISPGEIIAEGDLRMVAIRNDRLGQGVLSQIAELAGRTPRRSLRPEQPVRSGDVEVPIVMHRNALVTLMLDTPTMHLTAQGKALEDGSAGSVVRIANTKSNRVVDAVVVGPNAARVGTQPAVP